VAYKEADKMLTILTEEYGKISVLARGTRRKNSPISAATSMFTFSEFVFFENNSGKMTIDQAEPIELFFEIRNEITKLALSAYIAEVLDVVSDEDTQDKQILRLGLNTLYALSKLDIDTIKVKATFELKIACLTGYGPTMSDGKIFGDVTNSVITTDMAKVIAYITESDLKKIFSYSITKETLAAFSNFSERYMLYHFDRAFRTLEYFRSIL
jgi:DNA repair protein RecO (recombination protein O)